MIDKIEEGLAALLAPLGGLGFAVERTPENREGLDAAVETARVIIVYANSKFEDPAGLSIPMQQREVVTFHIVVRARRLQERNGVYLVLALVRKLLFGKKPMAGASPLWGVRQSFEELEEKNGVWRFSLVVSTSVLAVAMPDPEAEAVLLQRASVYFVPDGPGSAEIIYP